MIKFDFFLKKALLFWAIFGLVSAQNGRLFAQSGCNFTLDFQVISDFNGFGVSCSDSHDGQTAMTCPLAALPIEIYWSNGEIGATAKKLPGGWSHISVTDATGCRVVDSVFLKKPGQIAPDFEVFGEKCAGTADGRIKVNSVSGGVDPIFFSVNGLSGPLGSTISPLPSGTFFMQTIDANNCRDTFGFVVPAGLPFDFDLGIDSATIFSGDTFRLQLAVPIDVDSVFWAPVAAASGFFLTDFAPLKTTKFKATAINSLGCSASDEFTLFVKTKRDFFAPNIIWRSASLDENRFFTIYTGGGVTEIERLEVFDRWGNLVFSKNNFPEGQPDAGWDGFFNGKKAPPGVFVFRSIVRQSNGLAKLYLGDFMLAD